MERLIKSVRILVPVLVAALAVGTGFAQTKKHKIVPKAAAAIALKKVPGKVTHEPKLEKEDGKWQYEVIVMNGKKMTEVNVDADTGKINSIEQTSAKEEAKEAKEPKKGKKG